MLSAFYAQEMTNTEPKVKNQTKRNCRKGKKKVLHFTLG